ncbi:MAG: DUF3572 domain-containing protein [Magnetospiraceae bacterium]
MKREQAETMALQALAFIAGEERALDALMAQTGSTAEDLKALAADPHFLAGVMDFLLGDESLAIAFCDAHDLAPEKLGTIRRALPGGETYEY